MLTIIFNKKLLLLVYNIYVIINFINQTIKLVQQK